MYFSFIWKVSLIEWMHVLYVRIYPTIVHMISMLTYHLVLRDCAKTINMHNIIIIILYAAKHIVITDYDGLSHCKVRH